jgi:hypothetical protein
MTPTPPNSTESPRPKSEHTPESDANDRATEADHDVPDEEVIEKTLPEPPGDKPRPQSSPER